MKYTKTEIEMMEVGYRAFCNHNFRPEVINDWSRTSMGATYANGKRESNAVRKLQNKGIALVLSDDDDNFVKFCISPPRVSEIMPEFTTKMRKHFYEGFNPKK
jgi:hypothetical protein